MKTTLKLEELAMCLAGIYAFSFLQFHWTIFLLLFFLPDLSMLGYLGGNRTGAFFYNLFHHKGTGILLFVLGIYFDDQQLQLIGIIIFSHSAFDRMLGYGLKYEHGFKFTHLGSIGKRNKKMETSELN
jgi:hypothetical protein